MNPPSPREEIEIRITSLLMGELAPDEAAALQAQIAGDAELTALHVRLCRAMDLLREASAIPDQPTSPVPARLSDERRARLLAHFKGEAKPGPVIVKPRRDWKWAVPLGLAASLMALIGGAMFVNGFGLRKGSYNIEKMLARSDSDGDGFTTREEFEGTSGEKRRDNFRLYRAGVELHSKDLADSAVQAQVRSSTIAWESQPGSIRGYVSETDRRRENSEAPHGLGPSAALSGGSHDESSALGLTKAGAGKWDLAAAGKPQHSTLYLPPAADAPTGGEPASPLSRSVATFDAPSGGGGGVVTAGNRSGAAAIFADGIDARLYENLDRTLVRNGGQLREGQLSAASSQPVPPATATPPLPPAEPTAPVLGDIPLVGRLFSTNGKLSDFDRDGTNDEFSRKERGATSGIVKNGSGATTLSGANTYTGETSVSGGVLAVKVREDAHRSRLDGDLEREGDGKKANAAAPFPVTPATPTGVAVGRKAGDLALPTGEARPVTEFEGFINYGSPMASTPAPPAQTSHRSDANIITDSRLTTRSGGRGQIGAVREFQYSSNIEPPQKQEAQSGKDTWKLSGPAVLPANTGKPGEIAARDVEVRQNNLVELNFDILGKEATKADPKTVSEGPRSDVAGQRLGEDETEGKKVNLPKAPESPKAADPQVRQELAEMEKRQTDYFDNGIAKPGSRPDPEAAPFAVVPPPPSSGPMPDVTLRREIPIRPGYLFKPIEEAKPLDGNGREGKGTLAWDGQLGFGRAEEAQEQPLVKKTGDVAYVLKFKQSEVGSQLEIEPKKAPDDALGVVQPETPAPARKQLQEAAKMKETRDAEKAAQAGAPLDKKAEQQMKNGEADEEKALDEKVAAAVLAPSAAIPQPEVATSANAFSTFSLNVSDVAFKLAGASLERGTMPDVSTLRTEEFINAFDYRDPEPRAGAPLAFASERARYPFAQNRDVVRFSVKTAAAGRQPGKPLNVVLLIDNSGSMERADRVRILQEGLRTLSAQLQPQDKLSVVTFARTPRLWADGVAGDKAAEVTARVGEITPEGGTNLAAALDLGYATALKHYQPGSINHVVLLTDGAANLGNVDPAALKQKVEAHRKQGIALDCFGIGWEGLNDDMLEQLSRNGDGRYGFINTPEEAATNFAGQLAGALRVAASDVKVQVEWNPKRVTSYRQVGYAKHQLTKEQFRDNTVDAAELAAAESGNALYVVEVNPQGQGDLATVRVRFKVPGTSDYREHEWTVPFTRAAASLENSSSSLRLAASAAAFSEMLAGSPFATEVTSDRLLGLLSGVPAIYGADARPKKLEWMIRQAKSLSGR